MNQDRSNVEGVVQHYFDALYEGDADKLGAIFHPSADLRSLEKGELQVLTVPDWLGRVRKRPSAKAEGKPREDFIVTIDRSDESTAFVKVRCQLPPRYFTDYLVAMKLEDGWQIVSMAYRLAKAVVSEHPRVRHPPAPDVYVGDPPCSPEQHRAPVQRVPHHTRATV